MSQSFLDRGQLVGYKFDTKELVVTMSEKIAQKMQADGWTIHHDEDLGHFVNIALTEA